MALQAVAGQWGEHPVRIGAQARLQAFYAGHGFVDVNLPFVADGIDHIESQSLSGTGIIKIFFKPGAELGGAMAQINAVNNQVLRVMPPGMTPPILIPFSASNVGVVQMTSSSKTIPEEQILDYTFNFVRLTREKLNFKSRDPGLRE